MTGGAPAQAAHNAPRRKTRKIIEKKSPLPLGAGGRGGGRGTPPLGALAGTVGGNLLERSLGVFLGVNGDPGIFDGKVILHVDGVDLQKPVRRVGI